MAPSQVKKRATRKGKTSRSKAKKFVYAYAKNAADGHRGLKNLLGGKGANMAEMCRMGFPVPPGFTITTEVCTYYNDHKGGYPAGLAAQVDKAMATIEKRMGRRFGDPENPLLVSVRSGARASMPGMMDTVLNLGLNDKTVKGLAARSNNPRFAWDTYRRFVQMYGDVVLGIRAEEGEELGPFAKLLDAYKKKKGLKQDTDLTEADLRHLVGRFKQIVKKATGKPFPSDPAEQLWGSIAAVFDSWDNERARAYRSLNHIPADWGTAVNVMAMVYGNMGENSATGVAFTRNPATGEKYFYGEYLINAQGEDVVAGYRTPLSIERLAETLPEAYEELDEIQQRLEEHYAEMQDIEFTIEDGRLFMLQCRSGKRTGFAAVRIATDLVREGLITQEEALRRVEPEALNQLLQPVFRLAELKAARTSKRVLTKGLAAGPGAACGQIAFSPERAIAVAERNARIKDSKKKVTTVLVRVETSPEDIKGMQAAEGILTQRGGMTSHAALVGRQMGKVCVVGASELEIDHAKKTLKVGGRTLREGDWLSLDGTTGEVIQGQLETQPSEVIEALFGKGARAKKARTSATFKAYQSLMRWADKVRTMGVRTNADQPDQCATAIAFGAEGIGLTRTEHMFFGEGKIGPVREMILASDTKAREKALAKLLPLQRKDFEGILKAMGTRPVTIRTLDPPLHEFLPHDTASQRELAKELGVKPKEIATKVESLIELNPMLGHRGCRLGISYPEITRTQAQALFEAGCNVAKRTGKKPKIEVMIPLVGTEKELRLQAAVVRDAAAKVFAKKKMKLPYMVGTMIELPRAALTAGEIAREAEFFSFGTNDLTQTAFGISRDDAGKFIPSYVENDIFEADPFTTIDRGGVGRLMRIAVEDGREERPKIKLGICGEHGGEPRSIALCQELGLNYVSCSPYRVPIARLAAAQAALAEEE